MWELTLDHPHVLFPSAAQCGCFPLSDQKWKQSVIVLCKIFSKNFDYFDQFSWIFKSFQEFSVRENRAHARYQKDPITIIRQIIFWLTNFLRRDDFLSVDPQGQKNQFSRNKFFLQIGPFGIIWQKNWKLFRNRATALHISRFWKGIQVQFFSAVQYSSIVLSHQKWTNSVLYFSGYSPKTKIGRSANTGLTIPVKFCRSPLLGGAFQGQIWINLEKIDLERP